MSVVHTAKIPVLAAKGCKKMKKLVFLTTLILSSSALAQSGSEPCELILYSPRPLRSTIVASENSKYILRVDPESEFSWAPPLATLLKWSRKEYTHMTSYKIEPRYPHKVLLSDTGRAVSLSMAGTENAHQVNIYSPKGKIIGTFNSSRTDYSDEPEGCGIRKPWICWRYTLELEKDRLKVLDLYGQMVTFNLKNGSHKIQKTEERCEDYR